ncbi:MAG: excinuclease ABC subunit UvrA, partial [Firmicutes bacterium]|nr:excinuclease ABC subunit UvrA [Bacillota bacterium]
MNEKIIIKNARENNLQNISLQIPKKAITVFTGVSGSGKSSIVFDTIAEEAGRLLNQNYSSFARLYLPKYRQPNVDSIDGLCTVIAVDQKQIGGNARSTLGTTTDIAPLLRVLFSRFGIPKVGFANAFSFNDPSGMCNRCQGIGKIIALDVDKAIDKNKSLNEGAILLDGFKVGSFLLKLYTESGFFDCDKKIADYSKSEFEQLVYAQPQKVVANYKNSQYDMTYEGLSTRFIRQNINTAREKTQSNQKKITQFFAEQVCDECNGDRYNLRALQCKINGYNIADISKIQLVDLVKELYNWNIPQAKSVIDDIVNRLQLLIDIGLPYLSLDRNTSTLSGGESQRVKIAKYISSSLVDVCYIFDEPSIGLHARDVHRLNDLLIKLRDKGNTVLVVEHDPDVIKIADHIVDIGPKAGRHGG